MATVLKKDMTQIHRSAPTHKFPTKDWFINPDLTAVDGVPMKYWKDSGNVNGRGQAIIEPMVKGEQDAVDAARLPAYKLTRMNQIDQKTGELIGEGFDFDDHHFSLSQNAQIKWSGLKQFYDAGIIQLPRKISTAEDPDRVEYEINPGNIPAFYMEGVATYEAIVDSGRELKVLVSAATTPDEVDAVVDDRTRENLQSRIDAKLGQSVSDSGGR